MNEPGRVFACPHCNALVFVATRDIRCTIFRHGAMRDTLQPINPHLPRVQCEQLVRDGRIYGCGKPFRYDGTKVEVCGYV